VTEDFDKIAKHAEKMGWISRAAGWHVIDNDDYRSRSKRFQQISSRLLDSAKKKNQGVVTLQYLQLTTSCIECHQYMRSLR
jgi:cytochrome c556